LPASRGQTDPIPLMRRSLMPPAEVINTWIDLNRGIGMTRRQMIAGLALNGETRQSM